MKPKLDQYLVEKYPKIFEKRYADMKETAMCWGFECDDGWFRIIDKLCGCIQNYLDLNAERNEISQVVAGQVKEKYGELRFYVTGGDRLTDGMIWLAQYMSEFTCQSCGSDGTLHSIGGSNRGWLATLCSKCSKGTEFKPYSEKEIEE